MASFIHPSVDHGVRKGAGFAASVSPTIETGTPASATSAVRQTPRDRNPAPYDCLSPASIDTLAAHAASANGTYRKG